MISKPIVFLFVMIFSGFSLVACGISADVHDAVVVEKEAAKASVAQLEKEKENAQASVSRLEQENETVKADLVKAQDTVENLNAVYPPRRFKDRNEIEAWLRNDDISQRPAASLAEGLMSMALEQQARALADGYIVSADYYGPDEDYNFEIWVSAVTENLDYFWWNPESDEVYFVTNTNLL